jgi:hypothetical protein
MAVYRGFIVWAGGIVLVLGTFLIFVAAGWPGEKNSCMNDRPNSCYCEAFNTHDAISGAPGVRQPVNTWFNLYSILTSLLVAVVVYIDRRNGTGGNPMRSDSWYPDIYIFAVQFLGLGSMWFHASMKEWGGITDQMSMFVFAAFLIFYTVRRLWNEAWPFCVFYPLTVIINTIIGALVPGKFTSLFLILILVAAYLFFEVWMWKRNNWAWAQGKLLTQVLWISAVVAIIAATIFWALSQTGGALCDPNSGFQPHGLLWHPLAGVMAVLLYFYWREDEQSA